MRVYCSKNSSKTSNRTLDKEVVDITTDSRTAKEGSILSHQKVIQLIAISFVKM